MTDDEELSEFELVRGRAPTELSVFGEVDLLTAPDFETQVLGQIPEAADRLVLDLAGLTFIDSSGLQALTRIQRRLAEREARLTLRNPSPTLRRMLDITGLTPSFDIG